jgi:hypothetical protein
VHRPARPRALPCSRGARTLTAAGSALLAAVGGHVVGGGGLPGLPALLLGALVLAGPAWWLARDERGWERLAAAQLAAQLLAHLVFEAAGAMSEHDAGLGPGFVLVAHVLSAAVAAAWLRAGERRARELSLRALALLFALVGALVGRLPRLPRAVVVTVEPARPRGILLRHTIVHRGPPLRA